MTKTWTSEVDTTTSASIDELVDGRYSGLVLVCGSRDWRDPIPIRDALLAVDWQNVGPRMVSLVHGGARGADNMAGAIARSLGLGVRVELADWVGRGRGAGHERNRRMLALNPSIVLAFKDGFDRTMRTGGTENMCRIAIDANMPVMLYEHARGWTKLTGDPVPITLLTVRADG